MMKRLYRPEELGRDHDFPETAVLSVVYPSNYRSFRDPSPLALVDTGDCCYMLNSPEIFTAVPLYCLDEC
jgi:hypothetical protein